MKPGRLSLPEWRKIVTETPSLKDIAPIIRHHHESFDGGGHPDGLNGTQIPRSARILTVAYTFDAMTSNRPYRKAYTFDEALGQLEEAEETQFDPLVTTAFFALSVRERGALKKILSSHASEESDHALATILEKWTRAAGY